MWRRSSGGRWERVGGAEENSAAGSERVRLGMMM